MRIPIRTRLTLTLVLIATGMARHRRHRRRRRRGAARRDRGDRQRGHPGGWRPQIASGAIGAMKRRVEGAGASADQVRQAAAGIAGQVAALRAA